VLLNLALVLALLLAVGWFAPGTGDRWFQKIERAGARLARRKSLAIFAVGLAAIVSRLALLPVLPVPIPAIHDEFSYLLAADTFAHGRLTNPPHPMWIFFDTFHVLQHPTYASKYLPAQGAVLALGQVLGHPWMGSLLSVAVMCMAMTWMLQGWFPARWALLGGVVVWLRIGLFNYYMDGYYAAAVPAIGAALVLGSLPRILHTGLRRDAALMGLGAAILGSSRPVEGMFFCAPVAVALCVVPLRKRKFRMGVTPRHLILPLLLAPAAALLFLGYYNWRVTGQILLFPYALYHREYFHYPVFVWQRTSPPPLHYSNPQFVVFFNVFQRSQYKLSMLDWVRRSWGTCVAWWYVYAGPALSIPLVTLPCLLGNRRARFLFWHFLLCAAGLLSVVWFQPHYAAPLAATWFTLLVFAMRYLRRLEFRSRPLGIFWTRIVMLSAVLWVVVLAGRAATHPTVGWNTYREEIVRQLNNLPGKHLVLVYYSTGHNVHQEWVYNAADIDAAKIVWAREIPGRDLTLLLEYFKDRRVWVVQADAVPPRIEPYWKQDQP